MAIKNAIISCQNPANKRNRFMGISNKFVVIASFFG
jgi:hypothetical protein